MTDKDRLTLAERWALDDKEAPLFLVDGKLNVVGRARDKKVPNRPKAFDNIKRLKKNS